jgi:tripartite-type tricarboxylate transporter receptor subunit TctC
MTAALRRCCALAVMLAAANAAAQTFSTGSGQAYPVKPIRMVVGPGPDALARVFGQKLTEAWGQPVIVDQRGGGGGTISAESVARAAPDGYTLLLATGTHTINPSMYKVSYDMVKDFAPISLIASTPFILAVHPSVPASSVEELIRLAKAKPGELNYGSGGSGTPPHLATELFKSMAGINLVHVPYKTVAAAITDLIAGRLQVMFTVGPAGLPQVRAGTIRALAVSTAKRSAFVPALPTIAQTGLPGFDVFGWNGLLAPAGTPKEIIGRLHGAIVEALKLAEVRERIAGFGFEPIGSTPGEFGEFIKTDIAQWAKVVKESGARID